MGAVRRGASVVLVVGALGVLTAPAAGAISPPCRMTPSDFRNVRTGTEHRQGMTRKFVKHMIGCGGKVTMYEDFGDGFAMRQVEYKRTAPVGTVAWILYIQDRVMGKGWGTQSSGVSVSPVDPIPVPTP
jgi:hypothetical protein